MKKTAFFNFILFVGLVLAGTTLLAQDLLTAKGYQEPPQGIKDLVLAPRHENVTLSNLSPEGSVFLNALGDGLTPMDRLGKPYQNLGGLELDTMANRQRRFSTGGSVGYQLFEWDRARFRDIRTPSGARISNATWSPDGSKVAFFAHYANESHVYVADAGNRRSTRLTTTPVLITLTSPLEWSGDSQYLTTILIPSNRGSKPKPTPEGMVLVQVSVEGKNELRTYPNLLEGDHQKDLYEYYGTGQIVRINVNSGATQNIGQPGLFSSVSLAPNGEYLRVTTVQRPFSNIVPVGQFANVNELWTLNGDVIEELSSQEIRDGRSGDRNNDNDEPQKRQIRWRPDGNGISYLLKEAPPKKEEDNGDNGDNGDDTNGDDANGDQEKTEETPPARQRPMDQVIHWFPPYGADDFEVIYRTKNEIRGLDYSEDCQILFITERESGTEHVYAVFLDEPEETFTIYKHQTREFYENPGSLLTKTGAMGVGAVRLSDDQSAVYLSGTKYHEEWRENAPQPFIDKVEIRTGETARVFESQEDVFERPLAILDNNLTQIVISRETPTQIANSYLKNIVDGSITRLTNNVDHSPQITNAIYKDFEVVRSDGIKFMSKAILPADWQEGEKLPVMFWFYPREFEDQETIDRSQRTSNINSFNSVGVRSMQLLITRGYAVVLPGFPIVGPMEELNDNFIPSIQRNWHAIIDTCDELGFLDRNRLALGGHSYGAFGTAHSMIHTPYFKAGIAGAGNYNRTLTPITFQRERRVMWAGRESYITMSPILFAERLDGALLMYHGADDTNVGTFPINSIRMFHALNGLDKTASLYMYPYEGHGQSGRETLLDMWARWVEWLDKYVKYAGQAEEETEEE